MDERHRQRLQATLALIIMTGTLHCPGRTAMATSACPAPPGTQPANAEPGPREPSPGPDKPSVQPANADPGPREPSPRPDKPVVQTVDPKPDKTGGRIVDPGPGNPPPPDPLRLTRPTKAQLKHPNLPAVLGGAIEPGDRVSSGATIVTRGKRAFLITTLDALAFESGSRTVDIALVTCDPPAGCRDCDVIKDIDSFRFRWTREAPDHCAVELREDEVMKVRGCKVWAFFDHPDVNPPIGDGDPANGEQASLKGLGVEVDRASSPRSYRPISASTDVDPDAATSMPFPLIDPPVDSALAGFSFVLEKGDGWLWLGGIGNVTEGAKPMMSLLGTSGINALLRAMETGSAGPVTELQMLERHLQRHGIPAGYPDMRAFLEEHRFDGLATWKVVHLADGRYEGDCEILKREAIEGDRVFAAVSRDPADDLTLQLSGSSLKLMGIEEHEARDSMVAVGAAEIRAVAAGESLKLTISEPRRSSAQVLIIEAAAIGERSPALPGKAQAMVP